MIKILSQKLDKLQKAVFYYSALAILLYLLSCIIREDDTWTSPIFIFEIVQFLLLATTIACYYKKKISLKRAFIVLLFLSQLKVSVEIISIAAVADDTTTAFLFRDMLRLGFLLVLTIFTYTPSLPYILAGTSMAIYTAVAILSKDQIIKDSFILTASLFFSCALMEYYIINGIGSLQRDNSKYQEERKSLFSLFNVNDSQITQFIKLLQKREHSPRQTEQLLKLLGHETERRIRQSVLHLMQSQQIDYSKLDERIPSLTATERKVAYLVLQGKTHSDMARELLKSSSNISVIRSNIRKKMGLGPKDNLAESLHRMMMQEQEVTSSITETRA